jgi:hypothetical protein
MYGMGSLGQNWTEGRTINGIYFPTMLDDASTLTFLANFPDLVAGAAQIPTNGTLVMWGGRSFLVFYRNPPGQLFVVDQTAYDSSGNPIDPDLMNQSTVSLWLSAIGQGLSDSAAQIAAGAGNLLGNLPSYLTFAVVAVGAYFIWQIVKK